MMDRTSASLIFRGSELNRIALEPPNVSTFLPVGLRAVHPPTTEDTSPYALTRVPSGGQIAKIPEGLTVTISPGSPPNPTELNSERRMVPSVDFDRKFQICTVLVLSSTIARDRD